MLWCLYGGADPGVELDAVRTAGALMVAAGGAATLLLAARRQRSTELTLEHERENAAEQRITELYTRAVDQLGAEKAPVRLGGLHALERLAQNNPTQQQTIVDVICAYLRMPYTPPADQAPNEDVPQDAHSRYEQRRQELQVRLTAQRILTAHLNPEAVAVFWADINLNLTDAHLHQLDLSACQVRRAQFDGTTFAGNAVFRGAEFAGDTVFRGAKFGGKAEFDGAKFGGDVGFDGAKFGGNAVFGWAEFVYAGFVRAEFIGNAWFGDAKFGGTALFAGAKFTGNAWFGATFGGTAGFDGAEFGRDAVFRGAKFGGKAEFDGIKFTGFAGFRWAEFRATAEFSGSEFGEDAEFDGAEFGEDAEFDGAEFAGDTVFRGAKFGGKAEFDEARVAPPRFLGRVILPMGWITRPAAAGEEEGWLYIVRDEDSSEQPAEAQGDGPA